jgi:EKC/KEOPS complex subunit CGI121/TPRKB
MESFSFPALPPNQSVVHATLYTNIKNAISLRCRIIEAAAMKGEEGDREREVVNFAFINARLVGQPPVHLFESYSGVDN